MHLKKILFLGLCLSLGHFHLVYAKEILPINQTQAEIGNQFITTLNIQREETYIRLQFKLNNATAPGTQQIKEGAFDNLVIAQSQIQTPIGPAISISDTELLRYLAFIAKQKKMDLPSFQKQLNALEPDGFDIFKEGILREIRLSRIQYNSIHANMSNEEVDAFMKQILQKKRYSLLYLLNFKNTPIEPKEALAILEKKSKKLDYSTESTKSYRILYFQNKTQSELPKIIAKNLPKKEGEALEAENANGFHYIRLIKIQSKTRPVTLYHLARILIRPRVGVSLHLTQKTIKDIQKHLQDGIPFEHLTALYSEDYQTNRSGGDLGWVMLNVLNPKLAGIVKSLKVGDVSSSITSKEGYQIVKLLGKEVREENQENQRTRIKEALRSQKFNALLARWVNRVRAEIYVKKLKKLPEPDWANIPLLNTKEATSVSSTKEATSVSSTKEATPQIVFSIKTLSASTILATPTKKQPKQPRNPIKKGEKTPSKEAEILIDEGEVIEAETPKELRRP